jgi:hypothetical protein
LASRLACCVLLLCGCEVAAGSGVDAQLQVEGATYAVGDLAALPDTGGPAVIDTYARTSWVTPGRGGKLMVGTLGPGATAVLLAIDEVQGEPGYWILGASPPDTQRPDQPTFAATLGLAASVVGSEIRLRLVAVDADGRAGPPTLVPFSVLPAAPPAGALVVALGWDSEADLDLHVVDPSGNEIWSRDIVSPPPADATGATSGLLDFDSNAGCTIDGRRLETVTWAVPPSGHYAVRVDDFSLCDAAAAHWRVYVLVDGVVALESQGVATAADARLAKQRGAGVLALEFDWAGGP